MSIYEYLCYYTIGLGISCEETENGGCGMAIAQLEALSALFDDIGGGQIISGGGGADIEPSCSTGLVCGGLNTLDPRLSNG